MASVRPTIRVRQISASSLADGSRAQLQFCVWSNSPSRRFDVGIEPGSSRTGGDKRPLPVIPSWGDNVPVAGTDGQWWIRDQLASANHPACSTKTSIFTARMTRYGKSGDAPRSGIVTVLIAPQ